MNRKAIVTFFGQSAFTVSVNKTLMIFSYRETGFGGLPESARLKEADFYSYNNILVFVPNGSREHFDEVIFGWNQAYPISYIIEKKAMENQSKKANVLLAGEGAEFSIAQARIRVFGSSGDGVSFLVQTEGISVFHAGDLNLWHWREQSDLQEIRDAEKRFYDEVAKIPKNSIDLCMFPLDPNLGGLYSAGANHFIMAIRPKVFFPMHFYNRHEVALEYQRSMNVRHTAVFALTAPRDAVKVSLDTRPVSVKLIRDSKSAEPVIVPQEPVKPSSGPNPFALSDMPVNMDSNASKSGSSNG